MNAANPKHALQQHADQRSFEPSMEEILASIRRIISDDHLPQGRSAPPAGPASAPAPRAGASTPASGGIVDFKAVTDGPLPFAPRPGERVEPDVRSMFPPASWASPVESMSLNDRTVEFTAPHESQAASDRDQLSAAERAADFVVERAIAQFGPRNEPVGTSPFELQPAKLDEAAAPAVAANAGSGPFAFVANTPASETAPSGAAPKSEVSIDTRIEPNRPTEANKKPEQGSDAKSTSDSVPSDLFSSNTMQSVASAFNVLAAARLAEESDELLGLARELMRPMLKAWLDDNLPNMVERMVRAEIERVARGSR